VLPRPLRCLAAIGAACAALSPSAAAAQAGLAFLPSDLSAGGFLHLSGEGTWTKGGFSGTVTAKVVNGSAGSIAQGWEASAIAVTADVSVERNVVALRRAQVDVGLMQAAGIAAHAFQAQIVGGDRGQLVVQRAEIETMGGRISLAPFTVDPEAPDLQTTVEVKGIALGDLAILIPKALQEAHGQIEGHVAGRWRAASGAEPGAGTLVVPGNVTATLRLAESPGFLTAHVPARIALLPAGLGPLSRWLSVANPVYAVLRDIEMGKMALTVETLRVQLYPDGRDAPRTVLVEITARPADTSAVKRVTFTINVSGPLDEVVRLGLNQL
jgi:hypothetical protein